MSTKLNETLATATQNTDGALQSDDHALAANAESLVLQNASDQDRKRIVREYASPRAQMYAMYFLPAIMAAIKDHSGMALDLGVTFLSGPFLIVNPEKDGSVDMSNLFGQPLNVSWGDGKGRLWNFQPNFGKEAKKLRISAAAYKLRPGDKKVQVTVNILDNTGLKKGISFAGRYEVNLDDISNPKTIESSADETPEQPVFTTAKDLLTADDFGG